MSALEIYQFSYLSDNYGVLIHDADSDETAAVDAGDAKALLTALSDKGWQLSQLWITHHHGDHTAGLAEVKAQTGCKVVGPKRRSAAIDGIDSIVDEGDSFNFGGRSVDVLFTPGHTTDMVNYHIPSDDLIFTGDTLFALGCGRVFEGTMAMMWDSLSKFLDLPPQTQIYCGHEYTLANARFAISVDPDNPDLQVRLAEVEKLRADGKPTVPSLLSDELKTNPFLRPADPAIRVNLGLQNASNAEVFAEIRRRKDSF